LVAGVAQLVEQRTENPRVPGSIPGPGTSIKFFLILKGNYFLFLSLIFFLIFINISFLWAEFEHCPSSREILIFVTYAKIYENKGKFEEALEYYKEALSISQEIKDKKWESFILTNMAKIYEQKEDLNKALEYYTEALKTSIDEKDKALINSYIGEIYIKKEDYSEGIEYLKKGIEIGEKIKDPQSTGICMIKLGRAYLNLKNFPEAEVYLKEGLKRILETDEDIWKATAYENLGVLYLNLENKELAKEYFVKSYKLYRSIGAKSKAKEVFSLIQNL